MSSTSPVALVARLARKELREILRDRRTIVTLVLMPVLLYPLLSIAFRQYFLTAYAPATSSEYQVALGTIEEGRTFLELLSLGNTKSDTKWNLLSSDDVIESV